MAIPGSEKYVPSKDVIPPASAQVLGSMIDDPDDIDEGEFSYVTNRDIDNGPKIEIDPGYRVRP